MNFSRAILISIASIACATGAGYAATPSAGAEAPDFVLKSVAGSNIRLSEYRGEIVMLAFWASWCGDCRAQLESLAATHELYRDAGVALLSVNLDQDRRTAEKAAQAMEIAYPVLHDAGGDVGELYEVESMPMVFLIDRDGVVRETYAGFAVGGDDPYVEKVKELLREY